ncbi:hypothetical protein [Flagellimonas olearia]|uniref:Uncharacterized protein n=1 Tax=Flagellimonas olearia TaxID=552546 RepID=A0A444VPV7_9FLAO|nr:hypothetical protein [Allomuricauda olearia]RYC52670.1 hypothetical protein DN53_00175 [Allomuricauda olearia]
MSGSARGIGVLVEYFSEFLQRLFEGNGVEELSKKKLNKLLKSQGSLTFDDMINMSWGNLSPKLDEIDKKTLDQFVQFSYEKFVIEKKESNRQLEKRIFQLIDYLDSEREGFSLERNNIRNSIAHKD